MDKKIWIKLCEKDMDTIEDAFFVETTKSHYSKIQPTLRKVWSRLCKAMGDSQSEPQTNTAQNNQCETKTNDLQVKPTAQKGCGKFIYHHSAKGNVHCQEAYLCKVCSQNHDKAKEGGKDGGE